MGRLGATQQTVHSSCSKQFQMSPLQKFQEQRRVVFNMPLHGTQVALGVLRGYSLDALEFYVVGCNIRSFKPASCPFLSTPTAKMPAAIAH